ncbi:hypothetical protein IKG73_02035 [Candidatus Saccharibacteria bacterium]|nr:hypothetical protein [Candidatus Saccharibacteria bacterium]
MLRYIATTTTSSRSIDGGTIIIFVELLAVVGVYIYLRTKIKNNEAFSGMGWGFFAGLFMGGLGDIIFYALMSSLLSKQLVEWNKGKPKVSQEKNIETVRNLRRKLGTGLGISFIVHIIIRVLLVMAMR